MPLEKEYYSCARSANTCQQKCSKDRELCWQIDKLKKYEDNRANFTKPQKKTHFQKYDITPAPREQQKSSKTKITIQKKCNKKKSLAEKNRNELSEIRDHEKHKKNQSNNVVKEKKKKRIFENFQKLVYKVDSWEQKLVHSLLQTG